MKRILFVCTGNTCRSPMAEGMLRKMSGEAGLALEVRSAGVAASDGFPISPYSLKILREKAISDKFVSKPLTDETVKWSDLILTMGSGHKRHVIEQFPEAVDKTFTLKEYTLTDPQTTAALEEWDRLMSEVQIKLAMSQPLSDQERARIAELKNKIPDADIPDPFGGPPEHYEACAADIESCLRVLLDKLKEEREG